MFPSTIVGGCSSMVEHSPVERGVVGSSPIFHPIYSNPPIIDIIGYNTYSILLLTI